MASSHIFKFILSTIARPIFSKLFLQLWIIIVVVVVGTGRHLLQFPAYVYKNASEKLTYTRSAVVIAFAECYVTNSLGLNADPDHFSRASEQLLRFLPGKKKAEKFPISNL